MAMQAPTRITIEVHPPDAGAEWQQPLVRVVPEVDASALRALDHRPVAVPLREEVQTPAAYEPGPCRCLDDEDCAADHANE
jgi:hypothetical protein